MNKKIIFTIAGGILVITLGVLIFLRFKPANSEGIKTYVVTYGNIQNLVSATGNVQPQNRLEIKPQIGGRIEKILVTEGQQVNDGDVLAIMSSTERAALLDAARQQGKDAVKEWEDVYKPTVLISPINAQVIVKSVNPGQTVTTSDDVIVLSDRLIVQAQVDETDIGHVKIGQKAIISLDAYPDIQARGVVDHIYYESKLVNNVTIYAVDIVTDQIPDVFRSGMSANVKIIQENKEHVLLLPKEAVKKRDGKSVVFLKGEGKEKPTRQSIETGIEDDNNVEIVSGLNADDTVVVMNNRPKTNKGPKAMSSPFMPTPPGSGRGR